MKENERTKKRKHCSDTYKEFPEKKSFARQRKRKHFRHCLDFLSPIKGKFHSSFYTFRRFCDWATSTENPGKRYLFAKWIWIYVLMSCSEGRISMPGAAGRARMNDDHISLHKMAWRQRVQARKLHWNFIRITSLKKEISIQSHKIGLSSECIKSLVPNASNTLLPLVRNVVECSTSLFRHDFSWTLAGAPGTHKSIVETRRREITMETLPRT